MLTLNKTYYHITVIPLTSSTILPKRDSLKFPGHVLYACKDYSLQSYQTTEIYLDMIIRIPYGFYGEIQNLRHHTIRNIFITYGLIEAMTDQNISITMKSTSLDYNPYQIPKGTPIGILIIHRYEDLPMVKVRMVSELLNR